MRSLGGLAKPLAMAGLVGALIVAEHDLGTAMVVVIGADGALQPGRRARARPGAWWPAPGWRLLVVAILVEPYRMARITSWLHPTDTALERGLPDESSQLALGSGGLFGRGLGESRQKYFYLPAASTDCILAVLGEELGFVGCVRVLGLFGWLAYRGMTIAHRAGDGFAALLAAGLTAMLFVQVALNAAVVTGIIPTTGVPLPLISYGGSAMVFTMAGIGLIMNVSRQRAIRAPGPRGAAPAHHTRNVTP